MSAGDLNQLVTEYLATPQAALAWVLRLAAIGLVLYGAELLAMRRILQDDGLMSWEIGSVRLPSFAGGFSGRFWNAWLRYPVFFWIVILRIALGLAILAVPGPLVTHPALVVPTWWVLFLFIKRNHFGQDGADQMLVIIFTAAALVCIYPTPLTQTLALWLIATQCTLAYTAAGWAKLSAAGWRDGRFLPAIFATRIYGMAGLHRLLTAQPWLSVTMSWSVILWESLFPLAFAAPWPYGVGFVAVGLGFHLANAVVMGLGAFFVAFIATYPALLYCLSHKGW